MKQNLRLKTNDSKQTKNYSLIPIQRRLSVYTEIHSRKFRNNNIVFLNNPFEERDKQAVGGFWTIIYS